MFQTLSFLIEVLKVVLQLGDVFCFIARLWPTWRAGPVDQVTANQNKQRIGQIIIQLKLIFTYA